MQLTEFGAVEHHQVAAQIAVFDPLERRPNHPHRRRRQPGQNPHQHEAEDQRRGRYHQDGDRQLGLAQVVEQHATQQRGNHDAQHRNARPEQPHRQCPAHDSGGQPARCPARLECLSGHRPQRELGEQITRGRHQNAADADAEAHDRNERTVGQPVERRQQAGAEHPQHEDTERQPERSCKGGALVGRGRFVLLDRPSQGGDGPVGDQIGAECQRDDAVSRRDAEGDPQWCVAENARSGERDGQQQPRNGDSDQVRPDDEHGQNELDAYSPAGLALRHPPEQPGTVGRRFWQSTALPSHPLQHSPQPLRGRSLSHHGGVSLIAAAAHA